MTERECLAADIYRTAHLTGRFRLRSGLEATEYFDKYRFESDPALLARIVSALLPLVPARVERLAGLELGGVPIATLLAQRTGLPALFVRKAPKTYGTCRLAEGGEVAGSTSLVVEDVVTTGGQIVDSTRRLRDLGATVTDVLVVIDRLQGGRENLLEEGLELHALYTLRELEAASAR